MPFELLCGGATAPGTTLTPLTMYGGDSLDVKSFPDNSNAYLMATMAGRQAAGDFSVRSPLMHDDVRGIYNRGVIGANMVNFPPGMGQQVRPQDNLRATISGSATAGDIEIGAILIYYSNLPGAQGNYQTWDNIRNRIKNIHTVRQSVTTGTGLDYSADQKITADIDLFHANTDYAFLGMSGTESPFICTIRGVDTGNLRFGWQVDIENAPWGPYYPVWLSRMSGLPTVPVINSANKDGTYFSVAGNENATALEIDLIFGELM